jgi:hypothetical protein
MSGGILFQPMDIGGKSVSGAPATGFVRKWLSDSRVGIEG